MADEGEDMWHVYNLITPGDELKATTFRKVQQETATGSTSNARRVKMTIRLQVEATDFDASACLLRSVRWLEFSWKATVLDVFYYVETIYISRVKGRNVQESQYVKMGGYHTLDLEPNKKFTLYKNEWDSISIERVENASDPTKVSDEIIVYHHLCTQPIYIYL